MNALVNLENGFNHVDQVCSIHQVNKVQAGPHQICPECAVAYVNESRKGDQARVDKMARMKRLDGAMIPERHSDSAFTNFETKTHGQAATLSECIAYAQAMIDGTDKKSNFIMVGSTGTGKTHLACATAKTLLKNGLFVRYITSEELAQRVMNAWDKDTKDQSEESVIYDICQYDLLILDEYGLHDRDKRLEIIHRVLTARYDRKKPTMLISNMTLKNTRDQSGKTVIGLIQDLGDRLWSRFQHDGLKIVECKWADARVNQL